MKISLRYGFEVSHHLFLSSDFGTECDKIKAALNLLQPAIISA